MKKTQYYLFDFDGTLVDSMPYLTQADMNVLHRHKVKYPENVMDIVIPLGVPGTADYFINDLKMDGTKEEIIEEFNRELTFMYENKICVKDGIIKNLERLKKDGAVFGILTASPHKWIEPCMKRNGMDGFFDYVFSCEDFNMTKSNPQIFKLATDKMGQDIKDVIFIDDNINAVKSAKKSGIITYGVYDYASKNLIEEFKKVCDKYIMSFDEL